MTTKQSQEQAPESPALWRIFASFFRLGATAFGGPAMVAYIRKMVVDKKKWLGDDEFREGVALCQIIPGATAMQTAAYSGLKIRGVAGAAASFVGFVAPAFIFMMILSAVYSGAEKVPVAMSVFGGLEAIVVALVANAAVSFGKNYIKSVRGAIIAVCAAILFWFGINPVLVIVAATLAGLLLMSGKKMETAFEAGLARADFWALFIIIAAAAAGFALMFVFDRKLFSLAALMSRIDLFAFGGGFASLPIMFHEVVKVRRWLSGPVFLNGLALGQVTPGPIVITATFIGYRIRGLTGGAVATVAVFLPSFLMVVITAPYVKRLRGSLHFNKAVQGILCSFVGLLLSVTIHFGQRVPWDVPRAILAIGAFICLYFNVGILWVILAGAAISAMVL
jgi:chromate transporter